MKVCAGIPKWTFGAEVVDVAHLFKVSDTISRMVFKGVTYLELLDSVHLILIMLDYGIHTLPFTVAKRLRSGLNVGWRRLGRGRWDWSRFGCY